jgi:hypothetical protein
VPLSEDLRALRDRTLADLNAAHDYYADTELAWKIVKEVIATGYKLSVRNTTTGTVTTETDLTGKARGYVAGQLAEATFQQFISVFESYFFDLLRLWLRAYPQSLGNKDVKFQAILDAPDKDAIASLVVAEEVVRILYRRPADWFAYLEDRAKLGCPTAEEVERLAEAKASRDVLVHERGVANATYESKAGKFVRFKAGERIEIPENYHRDTWELLRKVVADVSDAAIQKAL